MKISLNRVKKFTKVDLSAEELVAKIGEQLGAVEEVIDLGKKYEGIIIVKVVDCQKLEGSDHLNVCKVDDGGKAQNVERDSDGHVQVICGAPNVHAGMLAAWLPPGTTVPSTLGKDPLILEAREIRGSKSNGMLASLKELAIGDNHDGILEIDEDVSPGTSFAEKYDLADDHIIDIENKMFTHRPDCFGLLGVAREIAGIQQIAFKSPDWYTLNPVIPTPGSLSGASSVEESNSASSNEISRQARDDTLLPLEVSNELPELVPRFTAIAMVGVAVKPSPLWLQVALAKVGVKAISNIVDFTNFLMLETGQPLHAYDYDKVKAKSQGPGAKLVVRGPKPGEKVKLLGGKVVEPRSEAIMIATDKELIGIGGVMGGADTEVDATTKNLILECANFDMYSIRRTAMTHGLFTDAVTRFTKGQSPLQTKTVLAKLVEVVQELAGGQVASALIDDNHVKNREWVHPPVPVSVDFINRRLGLELKNEAVIKLLENVEFKVGIANENLMVTAPFWRTDIELREDIVEEVGRLYGYDKLPLKLPQRDITPAAKNPLLELKDQVRAALAKAGANELLTYSFVHGNLLDKVGQDKSKAFALSNALSPELQYYRLSLTPSLLEKVHPNIKAGFDEFAIFEIGKGHNKSHFEDDLPKEVEKTALVVANSAKNSEFAGAPYYRARKYLDYLAESLGLSLKCEPLGKEPDYQSARPFDHNRSAHVVDIQSGLVVGIIGEFKQSVSKSLKLPPNCAGFELSTAKLLSLKDLNQQNYVPLPRFPKVTQDITLKVPASLLYQELFDFVWEELQKAQPKNCLPKLEPLDIYQREGDSEHKQITLRLELANYDRTLTDAEVNALLDKVAGSAKTKFGAERV